MKNLLELPSDVLIQTLSHLSASDLRNFALVCKKANFISSQDVFWSTFLLAGWDVFQMPAKQLYLESPEYRKIEYITHEKRFDELVKLRLYFINEGYANLSLALLAEKDIKLLYLWLLSNESPFRFSNFLDNFISALDAADKLLKKPLLIGQIFDLVSKHGIDNSLRFISELNQAPIVLNNEQILQKILALVEARSFIEQTEYPYYFFTLVRSLNAADRLSESFKLQYLDWLIELKHPLAGASDLLDWLNFATVLIEHPDLENNVVSSIFKLIEQYGFQPRNHSDGLLDYLCAAGEFVHELNSLVYHLITAYEEHPIEVCANFCAAVVKEGFYTVSNVLSLLNEAKNILANQSLLSNVLNTIFKLDFTYADSFIIALNKNSSVLKNSRNMKIFFKIDEGEDYLQLVWLCNKLGELKCQKALDIIFSTIEEQGHEAASHLASLIITTPLMTNNESLLDEMVSLKKEKAITFENAFADIAARKHLSCDVNLLKTSCTFFAWKSGFMSKRKLYEFPKQDEEQSELSNCKI